MPVTAILTAAGSGSRLGHALPKALVPVDGTPLVVHAARGLAASGAVDRIVVTVPVDHQAAFATVMTHAAGTLHDVPVMLVVGGATRQASVAAALAVLGEDVDVVLVHDAARALTPPALVDAVVRAVRAGHGAVIPGLPVADTVVDVGDGAARPVDRTRLRTVQTPQGFSRDVLDRAHAAAAHRADDEAVAATDDASLCAAVGQEVTVVPGSDEAFKVTTGRDLAVAAAVLAERSARDPERYEEPEQTERAGEAVR